MSINRQLSDYIFFYPDVLDSKTCKKIISRYDNKDWDGWKTSKFVNKNSPSETTSDEVLMDEYWIKNKNPYHKNIKKAFDYCVEDYIHFNPRIGKNEIEFTDFRINRYVPGGFMQQHTDAIHHSHGQKQGYPHLTSLLFLNDDFEGGDFVLCDDQYIEKKQGSALVFPSNFMFPHEVKKVTEGKRFSIMTWIM